MSPVWLDISTSTHKKTNHNINFISFRNQMHISRGDDDLPKQNPSPIHDLLLENTHP
jgi:hypothetical protein